MKPNRPTGQSRRKKSKLVGGTIDRLTKIIYGSGDWGRASFNTLRQIFYAIFLTDVVRLDPRLASFASLISIIWDAVNDPLVGALSDGVQTRWGRRRPFLLLFAIPFALAFVLLWWAPPWHSQALLMIHVTLAYMVSDTIQTLVTVPYLALTPEIASGYDDRTSLTSFRMFFNLCASLITAVAAPVIVSATLKAGLTQQQGYLTVAAIFGGLASIPFLLIFFRVREQPKARIPEEEAPTFIDTVKILWQNTPFRYATGIYVLNWIAFDIVALMLPYFLIYWISGGDLMAKANIFGLKIELQSAVLGLLLLTATLAIPIWTRISHRYSKRSAYIMGMIAWMVIQIAIISVQPGETTLIMGLAVLAGLSVSNAHIMPEAIFPDVIDWDEVQTHTRREGLYYGAVNFIRKLSSAFAIFIALQVLGWFGYQAPPKGAMLFVQSNQALSAIRVVTGPVVAFLLFSAVVVAWFYPLSRERQRRIQDLLSRRRKRTRKSAPVSISR